MLTPSVAPVALAYPASDTAFTGGALNATVTFPPGVNLVTGPSLRLLTNGTYLDSSVDVSGVPYVVNGSEFRTSTTDFNSGSERTNVVASMGSMFLVTTNTATTFNASNNFGNGTSLGIAQSSGSLVLNGTSSGSYTTLTLNANGVPWGFLFANARVYAPDTLSFSLLDANDTLVASGLQSGSRIPFSTGEMPSLKIQLDLETAGGAFPPSVTAFGYGQRAADYQAGTGVSHTGIAAESVGGIARSLPNAATLNKDAGNPIISVQASTYYAQYLSQPFVTYLNGSYSMFMSAGTNVGHNGAGIARATSSDLLTWTLDASILLTPTASSYDEWGMTHPFVFADPEGSGYIMFYTAWTSSSAAQLARATSPDGTTWTKTGVVLAPGTAAWEDYAVGMAARVDYDAQSDTYTLYYSGTGTSTGGGFALGVATSDDGVTWTRGGANPVMARTFGGPDQDDAQGGKITAWAGLLFYYYSCNNGGYFTCLANSADGVTWSKVGRVINRTAAAFDSTFAADAHAVIAANGTLHVFYAGFDGTLSQIGRTTAPFAAGEYTGRFDLLAGPTPDWVTFSKDSTNPVISVQPGTYYSAYLSQPHIVKMGNEWWMYLSAGTGPGYAGANIARATTTDLATWTMDSAPLLSPTTGTYDAGGLIHPYVVANPFGSGYFLYYTAVSAGGVFSIALATSPDAVAWTKVGAVLNATGTTWESNGVGAVSYARYNATFDRLRIWYAGYDAAGGSSTGIASTGEGVNFIRLMGQPALPRGGFNSSDQDMAQGGKVADLRGTVAFYYTCKGATTKINTCLATSTDGGFALSKKGLVLNASSSGFDSLYAADPAAVLTDTELLLFYAGFDGTTSQIGLARGAFDPAAPGAWLGRAQELPRSMNAFAANASAGTGATLSFAIRSSADGITWSNYETVSASDTSLSTPMQRYLQYRVSFTAGTSASTFRSAQFNFTSYFEWGRYRSDHMPFTAPLNRVMVDPFVTGFGQVDWYAEVDGIPAIKLAPGAWVNTTGGGQGVVIRADFWGASSETPIVLSFTARVESDGIPTDVTLRVGQASPRLVRLGALTAPVRLTLPALDLNSAIADALAASPFLITANITVNVTSNNFGRVLLTNLLLNYTLRNPLTATYLPAATAVSVNETATLNFSVNASTCCGATITYTWYADGMQQPPSTGASFAYTPTFDDAGVHTVILQLANGDITLTRTWTVTVLNVNRAPFLISTSPATDPTASHSASVTFGADVGDPDDDPLNFAWSVDGAPWGIASNETSVLGLPPGTHTVNLTAFDASLSVTYSWLLTLTDEAPTATFAPASPASLSHRASLTFEVFASDPDGDPLSYRWIVAGATRSEATSSLVVTNPPIGQFTVHVDVSGGALSIAYDWTVVSTDASPVAVYAPADPVSVSHTASLEFSVEASDPDGDSISYEWTVDATAMTAALGSRFTPPPLGIGPHNVSVSVTAGALRITHRWSVTITNAAPALGTRTPAGGTGSDTSAAQSFSVQASDPDGDALTYAWSVDGALRTETGATFSLPAGLPAGRHTVAVTVSDGQGGTTAANWTFTVPPPASVAGSSTGLVLILALVGAAAVAGVLFLRKKRKGGQA